MTKSDLKEALKRATEDSGSYDEMLDDIINYIAKNFKVKKKKE
jgi:hypothetical protein